MMSDIYRSLLLSRQVQKEAPSGELFCPVLKMTKSCIPNKKATLKNYAVFF